MLSSIFDPYARRQLHQGFYHKHMTTYHTCCGQHLMTSSSIKPFKPPNQRQLCPAVSPSLNPRAWHLSVRMSSCKASVSDLASSKSETGALIEFHVAGPFQPSRNPICVPLRKPHSCASTSLTSIRPPRHSPGGKMKAHPRETLFFRQLLCPTIHRRPPLPKRLPYSFLCPDYDGYYSCLTDFLLFPKLLAVEISQGCNAQNKKSAGCDWREATYLNKHFTVSGELNEGAEEFNNQRPFFRLSKSTGRAWPLAEASRFVGERTGPSFLSLCGLWVSFVRLGGYHRHRNLNSPHGPRKFR